ncbi:MULTISPECIES: glycosyltransferase family 2 protein [unclassified Pseudomonas]|uniref:glycosyltransferase family 2 protein n=1 Tax=unclassified Pseudomonas TaxID=196821 RepID=UPI00131E8B58|nr:MULTISPECIES: glycosyltransferase family 2 protein [unclassified Pseudomonas]
MNILLLAAGPSDIDSHDGAYPLCLAEFDGVPLIQHIIESISPLEPSNLMVALKKNEIDRYHLDNVVTMLSPSAKVISVQGETKGAACTALLSIGHIDNDEPLLIINANEFLTFDFNDVIDDFRKRSLDAGVVTFSSIHPRYSYVKLSSEGFVIEASEKNPISKNATVGFYWFKRGAFFVSAAKGMIRKDAKTNGIFYICPALNELVLNQLVIGTYQIDLDDYHPFKTERQLMQYNAG